MAKDSEPVKLPLHIRLMEARDIPRIGDISASAFNSDELFQWLAPKKEQYPSSFRDWMVSRDRTRLFENGIWCYVCVPSPHAYDHDEIMGFAFFERHSGTSQPDSTDAEKSEARRTDPWAQNHLSLWDKINFKLLHLEMKYTQKTKLFPALDYAAFDEFLASMANDEAVFGPLYAGVRHWHLGVIGVDPSHQRKGVASALIRSVMKLAEEESQLLGYSVPMTLTSSAMGAKTYPKLGFKVVDWVQAPESAVSIHRANSGQAFVWDRENTWIEDAPADRTSNGKPIEAVWTKRAKAMLKDKEIKGNEFLKEALHPLEVPLATV